MMQRASIGITLLVLSHLVWANSSSALAQAGSAGGTIGKQDKSISGSEEPDTPRAAPQPKRAAAHEASSGAACGRIVGTWNWVLDGEVTTRPDGTYTYAFPRARGAGRWSCRDGTRVVLRANGREDRMILSADGMTMTGVSWLTHFTVPFSVHKRQ
jgi:hypothetical protein